MSKAKKAASLLIYALIIVIAAITVTDTGGVFRTLPFIFILPAAATFLYNKRLFTVLITFVTAFTVCAAQSGDIAESAVVSLICAVLAFLGIYVKRLIVTACVCDEKTKKIFCTLLAVIISAVSLVGYFIYFGNPVSMAAARSQNMKYIGENYGENDIKIGKTLYDFSEKRYFTNITFTDGSPMNADISKKNNVIIDGYQNYYEYKYMSQRAEILAQIISKSFREDVGIGCNTVETDIISAPNISAEQAFGKMVFDIYFGTQTADEAVFAEKCKAYSDVVRESGFEHMALKFYGGSAGDFYYEMTVESDFSGDLSQKVQPFNESHLVKRETEADYKDHWDHGR